MKEVTANNITYQYMPGQLNKFYARFGDKHYSVELRLVAHMLNSIDKSDKIDFTQIEAFGEFKSTDSSKDSGPDGINGEILKLCYKQLSYIYHF